jgi:histidine triad (HIT) family protein
MTDCIFCKIVKGDAPADISYQDEEMTIFSPLKPHAPGHALVVPNQHAASAIEDLSLTAKTFAAAAAYARLLPASNILTSVGEQATQTVMHLHVHVIPRSATDALHHDWPWCRDKD